MNVRKKIVTDENHQPVAVQIDYDDWLRIARELDLETLDEEGASDTSAASADQDNADQDNNLGVLLDASKGIWQGGDGLEYQRRIRAEWTRPWDPEAQEDDAETTLLDSVILIDHFNGIEQATAYVNGLGEEACISVVTRAEVLVGFSKGETLRRARSVLDALPLLNIVRSDADKAARLRRRYGWKLPDAFQAALTQRHGLTLATRNTHDFDPDVHAFVDIPYRV